MARGGKKELPVRDRILAVATRLFRINGYGETGITQILEEAGAARASLYHHYPTKEALGTAYLQKFGNAQVQLLSALMRRYSDPEKFASAWANMLRREAKSVGLNGCAMANLRAQTPAEQVKLHAEIRKTAGETIATIRSYIESCQERGTLPAKLDSEVTARRIFAAYEGAMQTWQLTGDLEAIEDISDFIRKILDLA
jgi:TetR/AcrR family transcriptional repressor of nem operon